MLPLRRIPMEKIENCRDLGGYACADSRVTQFGKLLRCGIPSEPSDADIAALRDYGIREVIDLRGNYEAEKQPSVFRDDPAFRYHHLSLYEINPIAILNSKGLWDVYQVSVEQYRENYAAVLRILLALEGPALYHCFLGKDRTGILTALLLSLAGAAREDIVADYQVSLTYLMRFYLQEAQTEAGQLWDSHREHLGSDPEHMERLLAYWEERYGGPAGYVAALGFSPEEITRLGGLLK